MLFMRLQLRFSQILIFVLFSIFSVSIQAAHLVGGHISYTSVGNNQYEVTLRIYRDCGGNGAAFDNKAVISVYNSSGTLITNMSVAKGPTVSVNANPNNNPCIIVPMGLCTEYTEYKAITIALPPIPGGYTITHQRCCRNGTISNIVSPGSIGNTYTIQIPENDSTGNNSPAIVGVAPTILCIGEALNLPITVTELDGDSLHYELCDIFVGGGSGGSGCNGTIPNPACPPPYTPATFLAPYTALAPMDANPVFGIDPTTGVLFGTPTNIGQYVVGICISEYRNGIFLSTERFDYQFNVNNCGSPIANFTTPADDPTILCDGLTVRFYSQAVNATRVKWDFGVGTMTTDTSNLAVTTFTYPAAGMFTVTFIAFQGAACADTSTFVFDVKKQIDIDISYTGVNCFEVQGFEFSPTGFWPPNTIFNWYFSAGANASQFPGQQTLPISWSTPGKHTVTLAVTFGAGCQDTLVDTVEVSSLSATVNAGPDQTIAEGETASLFALGGNQYYWYANLPAYFSNQFAQATTTIPIADTTTYYVEVTDEFGCKGLDSLQIFVIRPPKEEIMNVITPNGDGRNDVLNLENVAKGDLCRISILNRWGKEVYQQMPYNHQWNGVTSGGEPLPDGTYYVFLQVGDDIRYKGGVTIIRLAQK